MEELNRDASNQLFSRIKQLVDEGRSHIAQTINTTLTITYWNVGKVIKEDVLNNQRAAYGEEVILNLSKQLTQEYGKGWGVKHLQHCLRIAETFPENEIIYAVSRELSWTHLRTIMAKQPIVIL